MSCEAGFHIFHVFESYILWSSAINDILEAVETSKVLFKGHEIVYIVFTKMQILFSSCFLAIENNIMTV
jgi:hypothetical protein